MYLDKKELLFGYCALDSTAELASNKNRALHHNKNWVGDFFWFQLVRCISTVEEPVVVNWCEDRSGVFAVVPQTAVIEARESYEFCVHFKPVGQFEWNRATLNQQAEMLVKVTGMFFACQLDCHIMYKFLTGFQLVESYQLIPPWTLKLHAAGKTSAGNCTSNTPKFADLNRVITRSQARLLRSISGKLVPVRLVLEIKTLTNSWHSVCLSFNTDRLKSLACLMHDILASKFYIIIQL